MIADTELQYWIAFTQAPSVGRVRVGMLEEHFGSLEVAWKASDQEIRATGLDANVADAIRDAHRALDPAAELAKVRSAGVEVLTWHDAAYPKLLRHVDDQPPVLYMKGNLESRDDQGVTIVGTRRPTAHGKEVARHLATDLATADVTVISGLARGIDGTAHRASLDAGRRTIAVLGCGVDVACLPEHANLMGEIVEHGPCCPNTR